MRWLYLTYVIYWSSVALSAALALAGHPLVDPRALEKAYNETAALPYEQRLLQSAAYVAAVALMSYPALIYAATAFGVVTAAMAGAFGLGPALVNSAVMQLVLLFLEEVARWHPAAQYLAGRRVDWRRYLLWVAAALSLAGVLSL
ncbi:hypothetical protein [Pyrobaculum neutrophilum]|uniref:Uncharacterized protein n=1 Tax=Pyrobaculum neutrophilum (strain DSM 2338 / JCM 9278 / NBRC 100436 / V24Sta) TaxID=444157 RepID=B1Y8X1_PYRNV|nr:hypothetical protein [Pyrobaculum neutrophilum]ACB40200.1 conserved hypothetical protein [Pyrobaculum neutrophilum V24Sta]